MTDHTEQTQTPKLLPKMFAELLAEANQVTRNRTEHGALLAEMARLAYAAGAKAGAKAVAKDEYQRGADAELEAICEWLCETQYNPFTATRLRAARRPKPQSLKEQALEAARIELNPDGKNGALIIRALESLPDAD